VRVRVVLALALALVAGALALDMSRAAPRSAGTDHGIAAGFVASLRGGEELCQPQMVLPSDAQRLRILIGTYGAPVPGLLVRFLGSENSTIASGSLAAGTVEGEVTVPITYPHGVAASGTLCIRVGPSAKTVIAGGVFAPGPASERVDGTPQPGRIAVTYLRQGSESWWQLLPTLSRRFGVGKASFFGDWTLLVAALLMLGVWVGTVRLLVRELT
jgi:hypothetical protein